MSKNLSHLTGRKDLKENLLDKLNEAAEKTGAPSDKDIKLLSEEYLIGQANVLGSSSFYDFLRPENQNKKVYVCNGSACLVAGTQDELTRTLKKHFKEEEIGHMCCLGRCHENASFHYDGKNFSACSEEEIESIVSNKDQNGYDVYHTECDMAEPILLSWMSKLDDYLSLIKTVLNESRDNVLKEIQDSGLRGRGGAGFPMGFKLAACKKAESEQKYIVCNADEGDPGSYSDRYLLDHRPHHVLYGMLVAGYVAGADQGVIYVRYEYPEAVESINQAINEWNALDLSQFNSDFKFTFYLVKGAGSYVVGEETALLSSIEGQRPEVRIRPPYPVEQGLFNKPTLVNNVETFANLPYIIEHGGEHFGKIGSGKSTGSKLISLDGIFNRPGVYEVEMGTPLSYVLHDLGQGFKKPVKALHIGGPLGGVVPASQFENVTMDFESFKDHGFEMGHASIVSIPEDFLMIDYLKHLFEFVSVESCGKCFPCRLGSRRGFEMLQQAEEGKLQLDQELLNDLLDTLKQGSLCALGSGLVTPVRNILDHFSGELSRYFEKKPNLIDEQS